MTPDHEPDCPWMDGDPLRCTCPPSCLCGQPDRPNRVHTLTGCTEPPRGPERATCRKCGAPNVPSRDNCYADYPHDFNLGSAEDA